MSAINWDKIAKDL